MHAVSVHHATNLARDLDKVGLVGHDVNGGDALGFGERPYVELCSAEESQLDARE